MGNNNAVSTSGKKKQEHKNDEKEDNNEDIKRVLTYYNKVMDNWMSANGFSGGRLEGDDTFYYYKMKEILEAFPNKGPPFVPTRIIHHLYMGSLRNAEDISLLKRLGITHILNVTGTRRFDLTRSPYDKNSGIKEFLMMPAEDHDDYDMQQHFTDAFAFLDRCKEDNGKALVHCNLGVNRSGAIVAAYVMMDQKMNLLSVTSLLKLKRSVVLCNKSFRRQLIQFARRRGFLDPVTTEDIEAIAIKKKKLMKEEFHPTEILDFVYEYEGAGGKPRQRKYSYEEAPRGIPVEQKPTNDVLKFTFRRSREDVKRAQGGLLSPSAAARPLRINSPMSPGSQSLDFSSMPTLHEERSTPSPASSVLAVHVPLSGPSSMPRHRRRVSEGARPTSLYDMPFNYADTREKGYHTLPRALSSTYGQSRASVPRSPSVYISPHTPSARMTISLPMSPQGSLSTRSSSLMSPGGSLIAHARDYKSPMSPGSSQYSPQASPRINANFTHHRSGRNSDWRRSAKF